MQVEDLQQRIVVSVEPPARPAGLFSRLLLSHASSSSPSLLTPPLSRQHLDPRAPRSSYDPPRAMDEDSERGSFDGTDVPIFTRASWEAGGFASRNYQDNYGISASDLAVWENVEVPHEQSDAAQSLKVLIRRGVPDRLRRRVWGAVTGSAKVLEDNPAIYGQHIKRTFGKRGPPHIIQMPPLFGGKFAPEEHYVCHRGVDASKRILCTVASIHANLLWCPRVPDLLLALLCFMPEVEAYATLSSVIVRSKTSMKFLDMDRKDTLATCAAFEEFLSRKCPQVHKRGKDLGVKWAELAQVWFTRFFVTVMPYPTVLRIIDCFLNEGSKILFRVALGMIYESRERLLSPGLSPGDFVATLSRVSSTLAGTRAIKSGFRFLLKRAEFNRISEKKKPHLPIADIPVCVYYRPKLDDPSSIFSDEEMEVLWSYLPQRFAVMDPKLLYSASSAGYSLRRLLEASGPESPLLFLAKTKAGAVVGFYSSCPLSGVQQDQFFGDGECFVFSLRPRALKYSWTQNDRFYLNLESHRGSVSDLSVGNGALCITAELFVSSKCTATFGNPEPLLCPNEAPGAECVSVELYTTR